VSDLARITLGSPQDLLTPISRILVRHHRIEFDVDELTSRSPMTLPGRKQRLRFLQAFSLNPPFLATRHQHRRVESLRSGLRF
jgi:hypothetical protein